MHAKKTEAPGECESHVADLEEAVRGAWLDKALHHFARHCAQRKCTALSNCHHKRLPEGLNAEAWVRSITGPGAWAYLEAFPADRWLPLSHHHFTWGLHMGSPFHITFSGGDFTLALH
jgi:hypothetical protein